MHVQTKYPISCGGGISRFFLFERVGPVFRHTGEPILTALKIKHPSKYAMIFDVAFKGPAVLPPWAAGNFKWEDRYDKEVFPPDAPGEYPRPHYSGKAVNLLFYDGHAEIATYPLSPEQYQYDL